MVTSNRQRVDTQVMVPDKEFQSPFLYYQSESWRPEHQQGSINTVHHSWYQGQFNMKLLLSGTTPHVCTLCLLDVTAPDLPPLYLHTASNQILEVKMTWQRSQEITQCISTYRQSNYYTFCITYIRLNTVGTTERVSPLWETKVQPQN